MLALADVGLDDVVYDLGAGDGRIVIAAARWRGARGVGIEIDPDLVRQARLAAERAGVADRVRFETRDLFTADLRAATVVTLYLSPDLNARLRPRLLAELRPGARIVSHQFPMADWTPSRTVRLTVDGREHVLYLWIVPARGGARAGDAGALPDPCFGYRVGPGKESVPDGRRTVASISLVSRAPPVPRPGAAPRRR